MPHDERAKRFAIRQMSRLGHAIADDVDALVHDVDAPFLGDSTSEDVVGEEGIWVCRYVVIHHLEIDGILFFHVRDPTLHLFAILDDVKDPIVTLASEAMGGCAPRNRRAVPRNWERAGKGSEARIDHVSNTTNCNREKHVLTHAFAPRFEQDDASGVPDGSEADGFESGENSLLISLLAGKLGVETGSNATASACPF